MTEEKEVAMGIYRYKNKIAAWAILVILAACFVMAPGVIADDRKVSVKTFLTSAVYSAGSAAYSSGFLVSAYNEGQLLVNVTAESGTSTLDIVIQTSDDNTTYYDHTTCAQITATGQYRFAVTNFGKYVRLKYTVGGTSFTFGAVGVFKN
jgi:hypothetical protein